MAPDPQVRMFRPAYAAPLAGGAAVVDETQPVAVLVDAGGARSSPVSWRYLPRPTTRTWPPRTLLRDDDAVYVRDEPDGPTVRLTAGGGGLEADPVAAPPGAATVYQRAGFATREWFRTSDGRTVRCRSRPTGTRWAASVDVERDGESHHHDLGSGSVTGCAELGSGALVVCVRRGRKRPWEFHPSFDLALVADGGGPVAISATEVPITALCWERGRVDTGTVLAEYVPFVVTECAAARRRGAEDVRFEVRDLVDGPVVEISFRLDGTEYVRTDEPLDELGRPWGLRALGVLLDEDLTTPSEWELDPRGRALL